jgi:hypothetical protein
LPTRTRVSIMNINKVIDIVRFLKEEPTNSVGPVGLQGDANPQGPLAGYDKPLGKGRKGKKYMKSNVSYKLWRRST